MPATAFQRIAFVRPLAGAGIEITHLRNFFEKNVVRPLAGAGIEIRILQSRSRWLRVRPLAGAGIEIAQQ